MRDEPAEPLDRRRKKLKFRAWRRGFLEIDLILGGFADRNIDVLDESGLDDFEALLNAGDQDVYEWVTETAPAPAEYDTPTLAQIRAFHLEMTPPAP
ncbi:MAG: succinate dehydrogenase assembly factor 2 [Proteobacteria bacterium]|nr:succinate dehydrogenase assembly factor 2 [Pseudomonadota bacterium]